MVRVRRIRPGEATTKLKVVARRLWPPWLTTNVKVVLVSRLAMSAARALSGVVLALYLATQGFSAVAIGAVFVAVSLASAIMTFAVSVLADRVGRKPFFIALPLLACVAAVGLAVVRAPALLVLFATLGTFGRGTGAGADAAGPHQPAESALLADSTSARQRTSAFARLMFCSALGAVLGAVSANLVRAGHGTGAAATMAYRPAFVAMAILAGLAGIAALLIAEPRPRDRPSGRLVLPTRSWPVLWRLWATNAVNGIGMGMAGPFMSYWLYRRFDVGAGTIGVLFAAANVASLASVLAATRAGRGGTIRAIVVIRVAQAALLMALAWAPTFSIACGVYVARLLVSRVGLPLRQSYVQGVAAPDERARVAGLSRLPAQGTQTGGQLLAGYLFQQASLAAPFTLAAVVQMVNAALYAGLLGRIRPEWEVRPGRVGPAATSTGEPDRTPGESARQAGGQEP